MALIKHISLLFSFVAFFTQISLAQAASNADGQAKDSTSYRADYFFFQTTGTPNYLLSKTAYQAVILAARLSGYKPEEIEVTITVSDKETNKKKAKKKNPFKKKKPKIKKFE